MPLLARMMSSGLRSRCGGPPQQLERHLAAQTGVGGQIDTPHAAVATRPADEEGAGIRPRQVDAPFAAVASAAPLLGGHACPPSNSRNNQARVSAKRRFSMAGDRSSAFAAPSFLKPTK